MFSAIEQLMTEHRQIEATIAALEDFCETLQADGNTDKERLQKFVEFLAIYVDELHHGKEENILFKEMNQFGFSEKEGPVAAMLIEHDQGRRFIEVLRIAASQDDDWNDDVREQIFQAGMGYASLLSDHIMKEDGVLYPMARQILSAESMASVDSDCDNFNVAKQAEFQRMLTLAEELAQ